MVNKFLIELNESLFVRIGYCEGADQACKFLNLTFDYNKQALISIVISLDDVQFFKLLNKLDKT